MWAAWEMLRVAAEGKASVLPGSKVSALERIAATPEKELESTLCGIWSPGFSLKV